MMMPFFIFSGEYQLTGLPGLTIFPGCIKCSFPWLSSAIRIIPFDSMPLILRGARLATTTTWRPTISSGLKCWAMPDTTVLFSYPRSTSSFSSLSAFSTFSALTIVPTRRSILAKSSYTISAFCYGSEGASVFADTAAGTAAAAASAF